MEPQLLADPEWWRTTPQKETPLILPHKDVPSTLAPQPLLALFTGRAESFREAPEYGAGTRKKHFWRSWCDRRPKALKGAPWNKSEVETYGLAGMAFSVPCDSILKWVLGVVLKVWAQNSSMGFPWECVRDASPQAPCQMCGLRSSEEESGEGVCKDRPVIPRLVEVWEQLFRRMNSDSAFWDPGSIRCPLPASPGNMYHCRGGRGTKGLGALVWGGRRHLQKKKKKKVSLLASNSPQNPFFVQPGMAGG